MQYSSLVFVYQVSVWAWWASRQDTVPRVTAASLSSSLFDVKACKKISFQHLHAHCMCTVSCSMCNPSCHSDSNPPIIHCATVARCFLTKSHSKFVRVWWRGHVASSERRQMCEQAAHLDGKTNTPQLQSHLKCSALTRAGAFMEPVICSQMCGEWNRKGLIFFLKVNCSYICVSRTIYIYILGI